MKLKVLLFIIITTLENVAGASAGAGANRDYLQDSKPKNSLGFYDNNMKTSHIRHFRKYQENRYLSNYPFGLEYCQRPAKCESLENTECFGARLPYHSTTLELTDLSSQRMVQDKLRLFQHLKFVPKCWAVIQPFFCALYMPRCINGTVDLPSKEMCKITIEPCKLFLNSSMFPEFLDCENEALFPSKCKNEILEVKFNTTASCMEPLIRTEEHESSYSDIEGCGLNCNYSLFTELEQIHNFIAYAVVICLLANLFAIATFMIDWRTANKYPPVAIFYVNVCFFISYTGWSCQFLGYNSRDDIVCRKDGTLRKSEPSANQNLSCVVIFVLVYYFLIAGMVWFVIFSYAWYKSSQQALNKTQERVDKKRAYFHLVAWSLPLILTITTMAMSEIDGDYVTGICFVGVFNTWVRSSFLLMPLFVTIIISGCIIIRGLILLIKVKIDSKEIISLHSSRKIRSNIVRMSVFLLLMVVFCIITFIYHIYTTLHTEMWELSLRKYILCKLTSFGNDFSNCKRESRPSLAMLQLQLLAVFGSGLAVASWVWCKSTIHVWIRYIKRKFHCGQEVPIKFQKHKIIAQAFSKREKFHQGGRISADCQAYSDPVGLQFELNSAATYDISSTWQAYLPNLMCRRGAVQYPKRILPNNDGTSLSSNCHSVDSQVSLSVCQVSIDNRHSSADSQLSVQFAELKATRKFTSRAHRNRGRGRKKRKTVSRRSSQDVVVSNRQLSWTESKCGSKNSIDSPLQVLSNLLNDCSVTKGPNLTRRTANAGIEDFDIQHLNNILSHRNRRFGMPKENDSYEENVSLTVSESK